MTPSIYIQKEAVRGLVLNSGKRLDGRHLMHPGDFL